MTNEKENRGSVGSMFRCNVPNERLSGMYIIWTFLVMQMAMRWSIIKD